MENKKINSPTPGSRQYKRRARNILIHKPMQREFTFVMVALLIVSTLAIGFVIHETIREAAFGGGFRFGKINPYEVLSDVSYQLIMRVTAILFVTLIVIGTFGVFFLHRIAGPVYRFRLVLSRLAVGEIPRPVKLREGDFFSETAVEVNKLIAFTEDQNRRRDDLLKEMEGILVSSDIPESLKAQVRELQAKLKP